MSFFTKQETMARMIEKRAELGAGARADFNLALIILGSALFEKKLKSGEDYGSHPVHVGTYNTRSTTKMIVGILHDVVEDSDWTLDDLRTIGFSNRIVDAVDAMTHRPGELYFDSIERCSKNSIGMDKKIEDLSHNMDTSRHSIFLKEKDVERIHKYMIARAYLVSVKKGDTKAGTAIVDFTKKSSAFAEQPEAEKVARKFSSTTPPSKIKADFKP